MENNSYYTKVDYIKPKPIESNTKRKSKNFSFIKLFWFMPIIIVITIILLFINHFAIHKCGKEKPLRTTTYSSIFPSKSSTVYVNIFPPDSPILQKKDKK